MITETEVSFRRRRAITVREEGLLRSGLGLNRGLCNRADGQHRHSNCNRRSNDQLRDAAVLHDCLQCNRLQQPIAVACSKHVTNVTTRGRFTIFARSPPGGLCLRGLLRIYLRCRGVTRPLRLASSLTPRTSRSTRSRCTPLHPAAHFLLGDDSVMSLQNFMYL